MNIVERIFRDADRSAVALISEGQEVTYGSLIEQAEAAAARIAALPAAQVALDCPNGVAHVVLALAIVRAGKCLVPMAGELSQRERERVLRETGVGAIVNGHGEIRSVPVADELGFDQNALAALNPAFIRFSSGTTGTSKGIVLSHESLLARVTAANRGLGIGPADRVVWILPMAHHFAVSIMLYLLHGATTIIENSHLAEDVLSAATTHDGTVLYGAPFHHAMLAAEGSGRAWPKLRLAVSTAATLPLATAQAFDQRYGVPLAQGLGIIEVGLPLLNLERSREKPASVGRPLPDYAAEVRSEGELFLRGPGMFDAYLHPWRTRAEVLEGEWFHTGDLARIDEDGDIHLLGRSHSVINVAGLKCFPEEIEAVLCEMPEVHRARVIGKPNARFGAVPVAEIVPRDPVNPPKISALAAYCRGALARYKVPVEFKLVESVPLTPSGKIQR
ncbi:MAG: class I adenylate-forming enzyme family protein [Chthoniobacter sp.]|uniref:class I adenylate-forming enzyme family protein n=1 Tax=Chthoniobacter sp. TaxID=2510640 RepID=UPI0032AD84D9